MREDFTDTQKQYLEGFVAGSNLLRASHGFATFPQALGGAKPVASSGQDTVAVAKTDDAPGLTGALQVHADAQNQFLAKGQKLCNEEKFKREKNPFTMREEMEQNVINGAFPKGGDVFRYKFHGLFQVAPAQNSFMCRMRFPGGMVKAYQFREVARLAEERAGGYCHITTRANLQLREIMPENSLHILDSLTEVGVVIKGSGSDNIRNITGNPLAGIDPCELIDTQPYCRELHHAILNRPEMFGLPRKFNVAFDGGGQISVLEDTNDIGFYATVVPEGKSFSPGVYFRLQLGGITGHHDFARDTDVLVEPREATKLALAIITVFLKHGDRTNRQKARLKYVLDNWGFEKFLQHVEVEFGKPLLRFNVEECLSRTYHPRGRHVGVYPQKQEGLFYIGVALKAGHLSPEQMRVISDLADQYGTGMIRLTVWQNLIISDIQAENIPHVEARLKAVGLTTNPLSMMANVIACTGSFGCKYAASDTKLCASQIVELVDAKLQLAKPVNVHVTGCHHSCAQHYIGDIGLISTKVQVDPDDENSPEIEAFHLYLGGGYGEFQGIAQEFIKGIPSAEVPRIVEKLLSIYQDHRFSPEEAFVEFVRRIPSKELRHLLDQHIQEEISV